MKIVGVGLNKTGTTSLGVCLKHWGLKHISFSEEAFELWSQNRIDELVRAAGQFQSFEDWPWPLIFREFDLAYPRSKFILTTRKDPETWFTSLCKHADRTGPTIFREKIYGHAMPRGYKNEHINYYLKHNSMVRDYFRDRPGELLEVCWENGDGWAELSAFLGFSDPNIKFPHAGQSPP